MSKTNEAVFLKVRMTPEEMAQIDAAKSAGMTRSAWAKRRLLSNETATINGGADVGALGRNLIRVIEQEADKTRDLIREKNQNLEDGVRRHLVAELGNQSHAIGIALKAVDAAVRNAGDRAR